MTDEESKKKILARRARFVAAALASAGVGIAGCGGQTSASPVDDGGVPTDSRSDDADTAPSVCLTAPPRDTGFDAPDTAPCLTPVIDSGADSDAGTDASADVDPDTGPFPCLAPPP